MLTKDLEGGLPTRLSKSVIPDLLGLNPGHKNTRETVEKAFILSEPAKFKRMCTSICPCWRAKLD